MLSVSQKFKKFGCFHFIVVTLRNFIVILVSGGHRLHGERRRHHLVRLLLSAFACTQPNLIRLQPFRQNHVFCARVNFITCLGGHLPTAIVNNTVFINMKFVFIHVSFAVNLNFVRDCGSVVACTQGLDYFVLPFCINHISGVVAWDEIRRRTRSHHVHIGQPYLFSLLGPFYLGTREGPGVAAPTLL
ncbi:uncharacterized protein LOC112692385 [Sipha flava]|uniref:Uncharacterized protein LOC112692385 n=1 Tax=Sipha flava TaxID=143950 RepID=A0A8B8GHX1_9HEMI|nr:uncharacterized protein LOC112692385 [Sipha flava]